MERNGSRSTAAFQLLLVGCVLNLTTGCFAHEPVEGTPAPASDVQVHLTDAARQRVSVQAGRAVRAVSGRVIRADADSLILAVRWGEVAGGSTGRPGPDVVRLAQSDIEQLQRPEFSLGRTLVLVGVVAVVATGILTGAFGLGGGTPNERDPGQDDQGPDTR